MGTRARGVREEDAGQHVAGLTVGQDLSERMVQLTPPSPRFSLGMSFPGFSRTGPVLVTPDEFHHPDDLEIGCAVDGETVQQSRTSNMVLAVPRLISWISGISPLLPGDLLFTGTPPASVASAARAASSIPGKSCTAGSRGWVPSATR
ncbi:fumarylacetoacetate hydrolase family protein [Streptomyces scabiei]|uniref:fumarylacetoacetate hydrolase family protein n=1 Tax=Streptomyces scabiei TaxID=1930 RepID=UPI00350E5628